MPVAKSYQSMQIIGEPYKANGRMYVQVNTGKNNTIKQVRWYTDTEYFKMYPQETEVPKTQSTQKEALGFYKGYITIFRGDEQPYHDWFCSKKECRYCRWWGWYVTSMEEVPADLPFGLEAITLNWEIVGTPEGSLMSEERVREAVDSVRFEPGNSEWVGEIGDRLDLKVVITGNYKTDGYSGGINTIHTMEDDHGNVFFWSTTAKNWPIGAVKHIRGTVKAHQTFKNIKQTVLTRCAEQ